MYTMKVITLFIFNVLTPIQGFWENGKIAATAANQYII